MLARLDRLTMRWAYRYEDLGMFVTAAMSLERWVTREHRMLGDQ
jgi:hypothetical protein